MSDQILVQIFVGAVVALIAAVINQIFQGKINYLWVIGGFIGAVFLYGIYLTQRAAPPFVAVAATLCTMLFLVLLCRAYLTGFGQPPFKKWRVKHTVPEWDALREKGEPCQGLISDGDRIGAPGEEACQFRCQHHSCGIYGPYYHHLPKGKYRVVFKIKLGRILSELHLIRIDVVASLNSELGAKTLKASDLSSDNFKQADTYYYFPMEFDISSAKGESKVEFRISTPIPGPPMTLDYVQLFLRLF